MLLILAVAVTACSNGKARPSGPPCVDIAFALAPGTTVACPRSDMYSLAEMGEKGYLGPPLLRCVCLERPDR
jgi:hypothetical protein